MSDQENDFPRIRVRYPGDPPSAPPEEVSDYVLSQAFAGLLVPNAKTLHSIYRELRKWRGVPNPDAL